MNHSYFGFKNCIKNSQQILFLLKLTFNYLKTLVITYDCQVFNIRILGKYTGSFHRNDTIIRAGCGKRQVGEMDLFCATFLKLKRR